MHDIDSFLLAAILNFKIAALKINFTLRFEAQNRLTAYSVIINTWVNSLINYMLN